jgi:hypothetical protein
MTSIILGSVLAVALVLIVGFVAAIRHHGARRGDGDAGSIAANTAIFSDGGASICDAGAAAGCDGGGGGGGD